MKVIVTDDPNICIVEQMSPFGGRSQLKIPLPPKKFITLYRQWKSSNQFVQNVFPMLSPDEREFLITGLTPKQFSEVFGEETYGD